MSTKKKIPLTMEPPDYHHLQLPLPRPHRHNPPLHHRILPPMTLPAAQPLHNYCWFCYRANAGLANGDGRAEVGARGDPGRELGFGRHGRAEFEGVWLQGSWLHEPSHRSPNIDLLGLIHSAFELTLHSAVPT
ncbi:hypothetical protein COLO4_14048 [Corchorus olitorius]|uniref:Uncharacterized protein n=1 Tax=Corchorus olitorius TaxID=93759 RepID=A0A1R3JU79_9ROSI|nr:hypothetical protein COLO4_14048 [Corchorus olitorius]